MDIVCVIMEMWYLSVYFPAHTFTHNLLWSGSVCGHDAAFQTPAEEGEDEEYGGSGDEGLWYH